MTVCIIDDEAPVRRALQRLLRAAGFDAIVFASPEEFLKAGPTARPACVIVDVSMPETTGLELQQLLMERGNTLPLIFLTGRADVPMCAEAMKRGALDFLTKPVNDENLLAAVRRALNADRRGEKIRSERQGVEVRLATLTPREREVLDLVVAGHLNKQIGARLGAAEKTIKVHRGRMMRKMAVVSVAELVHVMAAVSAEPHLPGAP